MNALQIILQKLISAFSSNASAPSQTCSIRYAVLMQIFQFANTDIYDIEENIPLGDKDISAMAGIYRDLGSPTQDHLNDSANCQVTSRSHFACADNRAFFTYLEYDMKCDGQRLPQKWATMLLCLIEESEDEIVTNPLFTMSGPYVLHPEGFQLLMPMEILCRAKRDGEEIFIAPETPAELNAAISYASQTLVQLLAGGDITPYTNQEWLISADPLAASQEIKRLMTRTPQSLADDIAMAQAKVTRTPVKTYVTGPVI